MTDTKIYATFTNSTKCSGFGCCSYPEQRASLAIAHVLKAARLAPCSSGFKENHCSGVDKIWTIWNMEGQGKELALKTQPLEPMFLSGLQLL